MKVSVILALLALSAVALGDRWQNADSTTPATSATTVEEELLDETRRPEAVVVENVLEGDLSDADRGKPYSDALYEVPRIKIEIDDPKLELEGNDNGGPIQHPCLDKNGWGPKVCGGDNAFGLNCKSKCDFYNSCIDPFNSPAIAYDNLLFKIDTVGDVSKFSLSLMRLSRLAKDCAEIISQASPVRPNYYYNNEKDNLNYYASSTRARDVQPEERAANNMNEAVYRENLIRQGFLMLGPLLNEYPKLNENILVPKANPEIFEVGYLSGVTPDLDVLGKYYNLPLIPSVGTNIADLTAPAVIQVVGGQNLEFDDVSKISARYFNLDGWLGKMNDLNLHCGNKDAIVELSKEQSNNYYLVYKFMTAGKVGKLSANFATVIGGVKIGMFGVTEMFFASDALVESELITTIVQRVSPNACNLLNLELQGYKGPNALEECAHKQAEEILANPDIKGVNFLNAIMEASIDLGDAQIKEVSVKVYRTPNQGVGAMIGFLDYLGVSYNMCK